jgi:hypothetical protein
MDNSIVLKIAKDWHLQILEALLATNRFHFYFENYYQSLASNIDPI